MMSTRLQYEPTGMEDVRGDFIPLLESPPALPLNIRPFKCVVVPIRECSSSESCRRQYSDMGRLARRNERASVVPIPHLAERTETNSHAICI